MLNHFWINKEKYKAGKAGGRDYIEKGYERN